MPKKLINWECWDEYNLESEMYDEILAELEEDSLEDLPEEQLILMSKIPKLVTTPMGMFQLHDKMSPLTQFDCWTAHTNFSLTKSISKQVEDYLTSLTPAGSAGAREIKVTCTALRGDRVFVLVTVET